ncbi:hypothetical protein IT570_12855 [Candidatus Sumerlaeota bacterium]|nr:hypothetical protein [Candidatus Sumerlaeota bacterium]
MQLHRCLLPIAFIAVVAFCWCGLGRASAAPAESPELQALLLRKSIKLESVRTEQNDCEISYTLQATNFAKVPPRVIMPFWAVVPPGGSATLQLKNAEWVVLNPDGKMEGPYTLKEQSPWGILPPSQTSARIIPQDEFRTVSLQRAELVVASNITRNVEGKIESAIAIITKGTLALKIQAAPGDKSQPLDLAKDDPYLDSLLKMLVINKDQILMCGREPKPLDNEEELRAWNQLLADAEKRGPILFARLPRGGVYALRPEMLRNAGITPEAMPMSRVRVFAGKDELAVIAQGSGDQLIGDSSLTFYVPIDKTDKKPFIPLWVFLAGEGDTVRRATIADYGVLSTPPEELKGYVTERVFEPNVFSHDQPVTAPMLKWSTAEVGPTAFRNYEFEASHVRPGTDVKFSAWLIGCDPLRVRESYYDLLINQKSVATGDVRTGRVDERAVTFPSSLLAEGMNTLSVFNPEQQNPDKANPFRFIMAQMSLPISSLGLKPQTLFSVELDGETTASVTLRRQSNFKGTGLALDVTEPLNPIFTSLGVATGPNEYLTQIRINKAQTEVLYAPMETYMVPPKFSVVKAPRSYSTTEQADYLAIYYPELGDALTPLVDYRAKTMSVAAVTVDDVYAAFSYGELSYQAIHDCIAHSFRSRKAPRLREVLLVGEGSEYWWEYRRDSRNVSQNMVPVFGWQDPSIRIRGDESYALLTGSGPLADVEIARISVNNPEELKIVVDKIMAYEENPPTGEWRNRHIFVTDDEPDFVTVARAIIAKTFQPPHFIELLKLQDYPYEDYFRGIWRKRSAEFTDKVIDAMDKGALTITYLGHGGPNLWSSERILHIRDIDRMVDDGRHPFLVAGSCDTGWVDYPLEPVRASLSEHFLRRENGGMIGAFIPIDGTSSYEHDFLISALYDQLIRGGITDLGTLCLLSKINYYLDRNNTSVTNQYLLMGDPASHLPPIGAALQASVEPSRMLSVTNRVLKVTGRTSGYDLASGRVMVTDRTNLAIAESRFNVRGGDIDTTVGLPAYLTPGDYNVIVETTNDEAKKSQVVTLPLRVEDLKVSLGWNTVPDSSAVLAAGKPVQFRFDVKNETDIDLSNAQIVIDDADTRKEISRQPVAITARQSITPTFEKPLPPGVTTLRGRLVVPSGDENTPDTVLAENELVLRAQSDQVRYLDFPLDAVQVSRVSLDQSNPRTRFTIPVYNMTEFALPKLGAVLKRTGAAEAVPIGAEQEIESLQPAQSHQLVFETNTLFGKEPTNFLLEVYDLSKERRRLLQLTPFTYSFKSGPDVAIIPDSFFTESDNLFGGRTVYMRYTVINNGDEVARNVRAMAYQTEPWIEKNLLPSALSWFPPEPVDNLYPGEKHAFRLRWDPASGTEANSTIFAAVKVAGIPGDVNLENNILKRELKFLLPPNLHLDRKGIQVSSKFLKPYERVTIRVPFSNDSDQDFVRDFRISVYAGAQNGERERIAMRRIARMKSGESALMQFDWVVQPGQYSLTFNLNEDREYLEATYDDNVVSMNIPYVLAEGEFGTGTTTWDFSQFPDYGSMGGVLRLPDGTLTTSARPRPLMKKMPFDPQYLIKGALGEPRAVDNLWGQELGHLGLTYEETGAPVKFRVPLLEDVDTNLYDVYFDTMGDFIPEKMSGDFKYRFEDQKDWSMETRPTTGQIYMGRYDVRDGYLDFEIAGPDYPTINDLSAFYVSPVMGVYESPVIQIARPVAATFLADAVEPGGAKIEYGIRYGSRGAAEIQWNDWQPIAANEDFVSPAGRNVMQWRASLLDGKADKPVLKSVRFALKPPSAKESSPPQVASHVQ